MPPLEELRHDDRLAAREALMRVEIVGTLPETGTQRCEGVSLRAGSSEPGVFRQFFRRETGLSPKEYRSQFRKKASSDLTDGGPDRFSDGLR